MSKQQLVRWHVGQKLAAYYAQPANLVVGSSTLADDSNLSSLMGDWHWKRVFQRMYDEREGHWLTPVELFRPHYSNILADFCVHATKGKESELEIFELGGGRGTNAVLILDHLKDTHPDIYSRLTYTLVDSSPSLHQLQQNTLRGSDHADRVCFELKDLMDVAEAKTTLLPRSDTPTVVLGMEVLDNLPHDKVRAKSRKKLEQAEIRISRSGDREEVFVPLADPLLKKIIKKVPGYTRPTLTPAWVPSVACGVMLHLLKQRKNLGIAFADFDWLPPPDLDVEDEQESPKSMWSNGEPIVTDMGGKDYQCYLTSPENCDILFPTDFTKLAHFLDQNVLDDKEVKVFKQSEFLETFGPSHVKATKSWLTGHSPLVDDFSNCSVLTVTSKAITRTES